MGKTKVNTGNLNYSIQEILKNWIDEEVTNSLDEAGDIAASKGLETLKREGGYRDRTGDYRKGFKKIKRKTKRILHNTEYNRTHLLEFSHALRDGGRSRAFPHWTIAERKVKEVFADEFKKRMK